MPDEQRSGATRDRTDNANGTLAVYVWRGDGTGGGEQRFDVRIVAQCPDVTDAKARGFLSLIHI